ncbi:alpha/beta hydrolase [Paraburkholderia sp. DHOC27]|uniref:alpha/beta hydrolase n=1 Tax=Paraburkholderia sp. DHOC27 TaxID=2303330 RepID=UPI00216AE5B4|nr:alpha/beta hydrolase [Paraburkholderia sp. DHOC27]
MDQRIVDTPDLQTSTPLHLSLSPTVSARPESWQATWLRRAIPLVMALHFGSSRRPAPDVHALRLRAHRYTRAGRIAARLLCPQVRRYADRELKGEWLRPETAAAAHTETVVLYLHGGAYYFGSPATHRAVTVELARASGSAVFALDYSLAPEHPFPAALQETLHAYRTLLARRIEPASIVLAGDSAGAGLALAAMVALRDSGEPLPGGAVLLSPWADLTTIWRAQHNVVSMNRTAMEVAAKMYLRNVRPFDVLASPARAKLHDLPPIHIQTSDTEALCLDARELAAKLQRQGNHVEIAEWHALPHAWHCFAPFVPEARAALGQAAAFIRARWHDAERSPFR